MQLPLIGDGGSEGFYGTLMRIIGLAFGKRPDTTKAADPLPLLSTGDGGRKTTIRDLTLPTINLPSE